MYQMYLLLFAYHSVTFYFYYKLSMVIFTDETKTTCKKLVVNISIKVRIRKGLEILKSISEISGLKKMCRLNCGSMQSVRTFPFVGLDPLALISCFKYCPTPARYMQNWDVMSHLKHWNFYLRNWFVRNGFTRINLSTNWEGTLFL